MSETNWGKERLQGGRGHRKRPKVLQRGEKLGGLGSKGGEPETAGSIVDIRGGGKARPGRSWEGGRGLFIGKNPWGGTTYSFKSVIKDEDATLAWIRV